MIKDLGMIKKIIYYFRDFCCVLYLLMSISLLKYIFQSGVVGFLFFVCSSLFIVGILISLLSRKSCYQEVVSYNLLIIFLTGYFGIVCSRLLFSPYLSLPSLYTVNVQYCKVNFLILSIVSIGVAISTIILYFSYEN